MMFLSSHFSYFVLHIIIHSIEPFKMYIFMPQQLYKSSLKNVVSIIEYKSKNKKKQDAKQNNIWPGPDTMPVGCLVPAGECLVP